MFAMKNILDTLRTDYIWWKKSSKTKHRAEKELIHKTGTVMHWAEPLLTPQASLGILDQECRSKPWLLHSAPR